MKRDIGRKLRFCRTPLAFDDPFWGLHRSVAMRFGTQKPEWRGYTEGEKSLRICLLVSTQYTNVKDTQQDRRTDRQTPHDGIGRAYAEHRAAMTNPILL